MLSDFSIRISDPARVQALAAIALSEGEIPEEALRVVRLSRKCLGTVAAAFLLLEEKGFSLLGSAGLPDALSGLKTWPLDWNFLLEAAFGGIPKVTDKHGFPADLLPAFMGA